MVSKTPNKVSNSFASAQDGAKRQNKGKTAGSSRQPCLPSNIYVTVVRTGKTGDPNFNNTIIVEGGGGSKKAKCDVEKRFLKLKAGDYKVSAQPEAGNGYIFEGPPEPVTLAAGETKKVTLMLVRLEIVEVTLKSGAKQFVNLKNRKDQPSWGRTIKVEAKINRTLKGIPVHFDIEYDGSNRKKEDLPASLQAKISSSSKTNKDGIAETMLTVSRFGGDKFKVLASLSKDLKHPSATVVKSNDTEVWRKFWFQITADQGAVLNSRAKNTSAFNEVKAEVEEADNQIIDYRTIPGLVNHPLWQFEPGKGTRQVVCVGEHNKAKFRSQYVAPKDDKKPKAHLIMCDVQWDPLDGPQGTYSMDASTKTFRQKNASGNDTLGVFDPPLKGGKLVKSGSWTWKIGKVTHTGTLTDANISIKQSRVWFADFEVTLPAQCSPGCKGCRGGTNIVPNGGSPAVVKLRMKCASGPWAGESGGPGNPHCLIVVNSNENEFNNTISHELGHLFSQVRKKKKWLGIPDHTDQYEKRGGQGSHCKKGATEDATQKDQDGKKVYVSGTCIMFHVAVGNTTFCDQCKLDLKIRNMSDFCKNN